MAPTTYPSPQNMATAVQTDRSATRDATHRPAMAIPICLPTTAIPAHLSTIARPGIPLEIIEYIIDMLVGDNKSLQACSVVSTSWTHRSRYHLFSNLKLRTSQDLRMWFSVGLGPSSHYVRSLDLVEDSLEWVIPQTRASAPNNFTSFCNVQSLSLTGLDFTLFDEHFLNHTFGYLSGRLTSLSIKGATVHPSALLSFVCTFPKLDNLKLDALSVLKATIPLRDYTITPKFQGKFSLSNIEANGSSLVVPFLRLPMAFQDVSVENCRFGTPQALEGLFVACQATMKKIRICKVFFDTVSRPPLFNLSPCKSIEVVQLGPTRLRFPNPSIEAILQTVTSTRLRSVAFSTDRAFATVDIEFEIDVERWSGLDEMFLKIANSLGSVGGKLELVFHALKPGDLGGHKPVGPGRFLEKCRAKATVKFEPFQSASD